MVTEAARSRAAGKTGPGRKLGTLLLVGVLFLGILAWAAPWIVGHTPLRDVIAQRIFSNLKGTIVVGEASLGWFSPLVLHDVVVNDSQGRSLLNAPKIESSQALLALLFDRADLGTF